MNCAIVLAAGKGTRMKTDLPKCAVPLLRKPMIEYIVESLEEVSLDEIICVVGHKKEVLQDILQSRVKYVIQEEQLGTGHAVKCAKGLLQPTGYSLILPGDAPLVDEEILQGLINHHKVNQNDLTIATILKENPYGYGRIVREKGCITKIVEEKDASDLEKQIIEVNTGVYCIENKYLLEALDRISNNNAKNEYYLTDIVGILSSQIKIGSYTVEDSYKLNGINDLYALSIVEEELRKSINKKHMLNGVSIVNSNTTTISREAIIEEGTIIYPGCNIWGKTIIGKNCCVGPNTELVNAILEDGVSCSHSVVSDSKISKNAIVGPFAHIRMNSVVGEQNRIGNFVELKNSELGIKTNVAHLTYIGDTTCGNRVNWGCGCVTVNYDGKNKHRTIVGDHVFIGCNTNLIAPVTIGSNSFIAAGSTIDSNVEAGDFAIARTRQVNKKGYAKKYKFI